MPFEYDAWVRITNRGTVGDFSARRGDIVDVQPVGVLQTCLEMHNSPEHCTLTITDIPDTAPRFNGPDEFRNFLFDQDREPDGERNPRYRRVWALQIEDFPAPIRQQINAGDPVSRTWAQIAGKLLHRRTGERDNE